MIVAARDLRPGMAFWLGGREERVADRITSGGTTAIRLPGSRVVRVAADHEFVAEALSEENL